MDTARSVTVYRRISYTLFCAVILYLFSTQAIIAWGVGGKPLTRVLTGSPYLIVGGNRLQFKVQVDAQSIDLMFSQPIAGDEGEHQREG